MSIPLNNSLVKRYASLGYTCKLIDLKKSIRINSLKTTEKELIPRLKELGVKLDKIDYVQITYLNFRQSANSGHAFSGIVKLSVKLSTT